MIFQLIRRSTHPGLLNFVNFELGHNSPAIFNRTVYFRLQNLYDFVPVSFLKRFLKKCWRNLNSLGKFSGWFLSLKTGYCNCNQTNINLFMFSNGNTWKWCEIRLKLSRNTSTSFWCFSCQIWYFTSFPSVSIGVSELVNVYW